MRCQQLVKSAGGEDRGAMRRPFAEGDAAERKDLIYLEQLPLFFKD